MGIIISQGQAFKGSMNKYIPLFVMLFCLQCWVCSGQASKKENTDRWRQIVHTNIADIRNGECLHLANTRTLKEFVPHYVRYANWCSKKYGGWVVIEKLYVDSVYTYFGGITENYYLTEFFKVANKDLEGIDLASLNNEEISKGFFDEVIPEEDKQFVVEKTRGCKECSMHFSSIFDYKYDYLPESNELLVKGEWIFHYTTPYGFSKTRKSIYYGKYNVGTRHFVKQ